MTSSDSPLGSDCGCDAFIGVDMEPTCVRRAVFDPSSGQLVDKPSSIDVWEGMKDGLELQYRD